MYSVQKTQLNSPSKRMSSHIRSVCVGLLLGLCWLFNQYVITDYLAVVILCAYLIEYFITDSSVFWKYFYLLFSSMGLLVGVLLCESLPVFLREINSLSYRSGATSPLIFSIWVEVAVLRLLDRRAEKRARKKTFVTLRVKDLSVTKIIQRYIPAAIFILNLLLFALVATKPFFLYGVDRFAYARNYMSPIAARLKYYPIYLVPLVFMAVQSKANLSVGVRIRRILITYSPFILFAVWIGERFGLLWLLFYTILVPATGFIEFAGKKIRENLRTAVIIVIAFLAFLILFYTITSDGIENALLSLIERVSMQGQLWWKVYATEADAGMRLSEFAEEMAAVMQSIVSRGSVREYGVYRLMNMYAPSAYVEAYLKAGIRYSAQGIELPYYYFKDIALLIVPMVKAIVMVWVTNLYKNRTQANRFIEAIIGARLMSIFMAAFSQGDWFALFSPETILWYAFLLGMKISVEKRQ